MCLYNYRIFVKEIQVAYSQLKEIIEEHGQDCESSLTRENVEGKASPVTKLESEKKDYTNDNMTIDVKLYRAQVRTVFGLQVLGSLTILQPPVTNVSTVVYHLYDTMCTNYHTTKTYHTSIS